MQSLARILLIAAAVFIILGQNSHVLAACRPWDLQCLSNAIEGSVRDAGKAARDVGKAIEKGAQDAARTIEKTAKETGGEGSIVASRAFLGPHEFPPEPFGAYGIVAFPQKATKYSRPRYLLACEAYLATLPPTSALSKPLSEQMVTVWPVESTSLAKSLASQKDNKNSCDSAVDKYDLVTSLKAIKEVEFKKTLLGQGPFLLAWAPSNQKGKKDVLVLIFDLSSATTPEHFAERFKRWRKEIEEDPTKWEGGFTLDGFRVLIREWADKWGSEILSFSKGVGSGG